MKGQAARIEAVLRAAEVGPEVAIGDHPAARARALLDRLEGELGTARAEAAALLATGGATTDRAAELLRLVELAAGLLVRLRPFLAAARDG
jgi:hypothetical protein